jgi:hypothetical protein
MGKFLLRRMMQINRLRHNLHRLQIRRLYPLTKLVIRDMDNRGIISRNITRDTIRDMVHSTDRGCTEGDIHLKEWGMVNLCMVNRCMASLCMDNNQCMDNSRCINNKAVGASEGVEWEGWGCLLLPVLEVV